jgi:Fe-S-cluster containining protein
MTNKCKLCGKCCKIFYINLNKKEYNSGKYKTIFENIAKVKSYKKATKCGANFLAKDKAGNCVYLKNNICSIHKTRPQVCKDFFCSSKNKKFKNMIEIIKKS